MRMPAAPDRGAGRAPAGDRGQVPGAPHARGRGRLRRAGRADLSRCARTRCGRAARARAEAPAMEVHGGARTPPCWSRCTSTRTARCTPSSPARRDDLRRHAGRDLVPRRAPRRRRDADLDAPRCARRTRRSACRRTRSSCVGALQPTPTFVTDYAIYPFVGLIEPGFEWVPPAREVAEVLELPLERRPRAATRAGGWCAAGMPFRTDTYEVGDAPRSGARPPGSSPTCSTGRRLRGGRWGERRTPASREGTGRWGDSPGRCGRSRSLSDHQRPQPSRAGAAMGSLSHSMLQFDPRPA